MLLLLLYSFYLNEKFSNTRKAFTTYFSIINEQIISHVTPDQVILLEFFKKKFPSKLFISKSSKTIR